MDHRKSACFVNSHSIHKNLSFFICCNSCYTDGQQALATRMNICIYISIYAKLDESQGPCLHSNWENGNTKNFVKAGNQASTISLLHICQGQTKHHIHDRKHTSHAQFVSDWTWTCKESTVFNLIFPVPLLQWNSFKVTKSGTLLNLGYLYHHANFERACLANTFSLCGVWKLICHLRS